MGDDTDTITIPFDDGSTVVKALEEYREQQLKSVDASPKQPHMGNAFRQAAADTQRLIDKIVEQL